MHLSFEFFPPKNDIGALHYAEALRDLACLKPDFVSITCGAGGSATNTTFATVKHIRETTALHVVPHIAFIRQNRSQLDNVLNAYKKLGVQQVVALRGDPAVQQKADIPLYAAYPNTIDFVADLKNRFGLEPIVSAYPDVHPLAASPEQDLEHLKLKVEAGAKRAISQFFFEASTFLRFRDKVAKAGIAVALTPGIVPIHNHAQVLKFAAGCGAKIPTGFADRFERWNGDDVALFNEGVEHTSVLCDALRQGGVHDFHFYTLNRGAITREICANLGLRRAAATTPHTGE